MCVPGKINFDNVGTLILFTNKRSRHGYAPTGNGISEIYVITTRNF